MGTSLERSGQPAFHLLRAGDAAVFPYLRPIAAVLALALVAIAVRVVTYYSTNHVDIATSPLEQAAHSAPRPATAATGGFPEDNTLYYAAPGVSLPVLRSKAKPRGPAGEKVVLVAVIDPTGKPVNPQIWHGLEPAMNVRAIAAAGKWRFRPGLKDGRPVPVLAQLEIEFQP